ncbi:MAG: STT3 domain-containing protein [Candidatus Pacearchaeota archaeon]
MTDDESSSIKDENIKDENKKTNDSIKKEKENKEEMEEKDRGKKEEMSKKIKSITEKEIKINVEPLYNFLKNRWVFIALIIIFSLSFYIRIFGFNYNYLRNIDSYWHYRYMKMIVDNNGKLPEYDILMEAPEYRKIDTMHFYHYLGAYSYMLFKIFFPDVELWRFLVYFPAFLASLAVIPCYFIGKRLCDKKAGIFLSFLLVFNSAIISRSLGGDPDSDAIVLLLPLIILAFFFESIHEIKENKIKKGILYSILTGFFLAILAYTWVTWHVFYFISGVVAIEFILELLHKNRKIANDFIISYIACIAIFFILTIPIIGIEFIGIILGGPFEALKLKAEEGDFPNVYVSVAEMMEGGNVKNVGRTLGIYLVEGDSVISKGLGTIYTLLYFCALFFSILYVSIIYIIKRKYLETLLFLLLWGGGFLFASIYAIRFSIFLALPLSLALSIFLSKIWEIALKSNKTLE